MLMQKFLINTFYQQLKIFQAKLQGVIKKLLVMLNTLYFTYLKYLIFHLPILFSALHLQGKLQKSFIPSHGKTHVGMMKLQ
jgi:hypothetical protein